MDRPEAHPKMAGFCVVMNRPNDPGNIGSVARAMSNFGLADLRVVGDRELNVPEARKMSMGGRPILLSASRADSIAEAAADCRWVIGTTPRGHSTWDLATPRDKAAEWLARSAQGKVAIVLGNEVTGLSNADLSRCDEIVAIPTLGSNPSLNIAQASLILFYELALAAGSTSQLPTIDRIPATHEELEGFYGHLQQMLLEMGYLFPANPEHVMDTLRHIVRRAGLDERDVSILRGVLSTFQYHLKRSDEDK